MKYVQSQQQKHKNNAKGVVLVSLLLTLNLFKVGISPSKKFFLFTSMIASQKWLEMLFFHLKSSFSSQDI